MHAGYHNDHWPWRSVIIASTELHPIRDGVACSVRGALIGHASWLRELIMEGENGRGIYRIHSVPMFVHLRWRPKQTGEKKARQGEHGLIHSRIAGGGSGGTHRPRRVTSIAETRLGGQLSSDYQPAGMPSC